MRGKNRSLRYAFACTAIFLDACSEPSSRDDRRGNRDNLTANQVSLPDPTDEVKPGAVGSGTDITTSSADNYALVDGLTAYYKVTLRSGKFIHWIIKIQSRTLTVWRTSNSDSSIEPTKPTFSPDAVFEILPESQVPVTAQRGFLYSKKWRGLDYDRKEYKEFETTVPIPVFVIPDRATNALQASKWNLVETVNSASSGNAVFDVMHVESEGRNGIAFSYYPTRRGLPSMLDIFHMLRAYFPDPATQTIPFVAGTNNRGSIYEIGKLCYWNSLNANVTKPCD